MLPLVRDATPADAEAWCALRNAVAGEPEITTITEPGEVLDVEELRARFADTTSRAWHLIATVDDALVGLLGMKRGERRANRHVADLGLSVARAHRGRGIGRALMLAAEEKARANGVTKLTLGVFPSNERARRLYQSLGYEEEGIRRGQFVVRGVVLDEILMAKRIGTTPR